MNWLQLRCSISIELLCCLKITSHLEPDNIEFLVGSGLMHPNGKIYQSCQRYSTFCKQRLTPTFSGNVCIWSLPSADFSGTEREREKEKEHGEAIKAPHPGGGLIDSESQMHNSSGPLFLKHVYVIWFISTLQRRSQNSQLTGPQK